MVVANEEKLVKDFFAFFGIPAESVLVSEEADLISVTLDIPETEAGRYIGRYAGTLDSLQLLLSMMLNRGDSHRHVLVDVAGYRERRLETLRAMVDRVGKEVLASGSPRALPPLSATERRQIHLMLSEDAKLTTFSQGEGLDRRLFIAPRDRA